MTLCMRLSYMVVMGTSLTTTRAPGPSEGSLSRVTSRGEGLAEMANGLIWPSVALTAHTAGGSRRAARTARLGEACAPEACAGGCSAAAASIHHVLPSPPVVAKGPFDPRLCSRASLPTF